MPAQGWVRELTAEGRVARRVEELVGSAPEPGPDPFARLEQPRAARNLGGLGSRLAARFGIRVDPGRRAAIAVGAAALVAVLAAGTWVWFNRPQTVALNSSAASPSSASASTAPAPASSARASPSPAMIVVDVVGKVVHPGIYRLPVGSRVDDALQAAGGALPGVDLSTINRAQVVSDGQQIAVDVAGAPAGGVGAGTGASASGPVNLNSATAEQLDVLPGVGPVLAQHILAWRSEHGRFTSIDQLREVSGIGEAKFQDLRSLVTV